MKTSAKTGLLRRATALALAVVLSIPSAFAAAFAMRHAAFPMAITVTGRSKHRPSSAR